MKPDSNLYAMIEFIAMITLVSAIIIMFASKVDGDEAAQIAITAGIGFLITIYRMHNNRKKTNEIDKDDTDITNPD